MNLKNAVESLNGYLEGCFKQPSMQNQHLSDSGANYCLEEKLRTFYGKKYAITFSNATTALQAVCIALELHDTEILTSPINWGGSISPFLLHKAKLRFASFDPVSLNLSVSDLPLAITPKTKAVLSVDYNGLPADSKAIKAFCSENNLFYISDSAQSMGSFMNDKPAGYFADATILSFSPGKSFFAGEGGAVITDDITLFEKLLWLSQHPSKQKTVFGISNSNEYSPLNGRMNPLSSILLNETFEDSFVKLRRDQIKYFKLIIQLQDNNYVEKIPYITSPISSTFYNVTLQLKEPVSIQKLNIFLQDYHKPFIAIQSSPKLIPFDRLFRTQFRNKFSCSENLKEQRTTIDFTNRINLFISPTNIFL